MKLITQVAPAQIACSVTFTLYKDRQVLSSLLRKKEDAATEPAELVVFCHVRTK